MRLFNLLLVILLFANVSCSETKTGLAIKNQINDEPVQYAIAKVKESTANSVFTLEASNPELTINTKIDTTLGDESYLISTYGNTIIVAGGNAVGLMYGLLQIKEQFESGVKEIKEINESPKFPFRALKFNLPWVSYRNGEALQLHTETCQDTNYWCSFLDMMAENRFNKLTLWNLHPFSYMVKTEKYPEACSLSDKELAKWQEFWKAIFRMAKDRGIETYLVNWNIFVSPEFAKAHQVALYCINNQFFVAQGDTSDIVKDYTRECVKEVINKYPNLTGLGITLGEGMGGMTAVQREEWLLDSYIQGMRMASRKVKFIHRVPLSAGTHSSGSTDSYVERMTRETLDTLSCIDGPINIELKFNWSHAHSCTELIKVHGGELTDAYWNPGPTNYKLAWMMRNEDFFVLRWGQPGFIRQHISENGKPYVNGYYVGSECYIPAKDYITSLPNTSYTYAFERQWMFYKNWGRLLYNPETPDVVFENAFENRFPGNGSNLFSAQSKVSCVPLIIASYWNATWDFTLYSEGMMGIDGKGPIGLISMMQLCGKQPMDPNYMSVKEYLSNGEEGISGKITPIQLADSIDLFCQQALGEVNKVAVNDDINLLYEVSDIKTWAYLGMYFSNKLRASVAYQQYIDSGSKQFHDHSVNFLEKAVANWHRVVEITSPIYQPMPLQHIANRKDKYFHWSKLETEVVEELEWLKVQ